MYEKRKEEREKIPRIKINNLPSIVPFSRRPCCERDFAVNGVKKKKISIFPPIRGNRFPDRVNRANKLQTSNGNYYLGCAAWRAHFLTCHQPTTFSPISISKKFAQNRFRVEERHVIMQNIV